MTTSLKRKHAKNDLYADVEKIKEALWDTTFDVKNLIGNSYQNSMENMKEKSVMVKDGVSNFIIDKPFKSIGIAVLTGFVLGFWLKKGK